MINSISDPTTIASLMRCIQRSKEDKPIFYRSNDRLLKVEYNAHTSHIEYFTDNPAAIIMGNFESKKAKGKTTIRGALATCELIGPALKYSETPYKEVLDLPTIVQDDEFVIRQTHQLLTTIQHQYDTRSVNNIPWWDRAYSDLVAYVLDISHIHEHASMKIWSALVDYHPQQPAVHQLSMVFQKPQAIDLFITALSAYLNEPSIGTPLDFDIS